MCLPVTSPRSRSFRSRLFSRDEFPLKRWQITGLPGVELGSRKDSRFKVESDVRGVRCIVTTCFYLRLLGPCATDTRVQFMLCPRTWLSGSRGRCCPHTPYMWIISSFSGGISRPLIQRARNTMARMGIQAEPCRGGTNFQILPRSFRVYMMKQPTVVSFSQTGCGLTALGHVEALRYFERGHQS